MTTPFDYPTGTLISLQCNDFNVEASTGCTYDVFYFSPSGDSTFRDALRTCGRGSFGRTSTTNAMTIGFDTDSGNPYSATPYRFNCTLTVVQGSGGSSAVQPQPTPAPQPQPTPSTTNTSCECGVRNEAPRIVGGSLATLNEFPWRCNLYRELVLFEESNQLIG